MAGLTYNTYVTQLCELAVVPSTTVGGIVQSTDTNFNAIIPSTIDYAELRIQRDLDLLHSVKTSTTYTVSSSSPKVDLDEGQFVTIQNVNVITPAGTSDPALGTVIPLLATSKEFIQRLYPSAASAGQPEFFAMLNDHTIFIGPWPNTAYTLEIIGTGREKTLGPTDTSTTATSNWISQYVPDLMLMASMVYVSGYQRNFGRQSDDPQMAQSYETQYQTILKSAMVEEFRKKFQASAWTSYLPSPIATPTRG